MKWRYCRQPRDQCSSIKKSAEKLKAEQFIWEVFSFYQCSLEQRANKKRHKNLHKCPCTEHCWLLAPQFQQNWISSALPTRIKTSSTHRRSTKFAFLLVFKLSLRLQQSFSSIPAQVWESSKAPYSFGINWLCERCRRAKSLHCAEIAILVHETTLFHIRIVDQRIFVWFEIVFYFVVYLLLSEHFIN